VLKKVVGALSLVGAVAVVFTVSIAASRNESATDSAAKSAKSFFDYPAATGNIEPVSESPPVDARLMKHGEWVYRGMCIGCHGIKGDGMGAVWTLGDKFAQGHKLPRQPRDFTSAVFKVRSTPSGSLPTDRDLFKAVSRGLVADQDMPSFKFLPERDRWAVIAYVKSLSKRWQEEKDFQEKPVEVGEPSVPDAAVLDEGKKVYAQMQCAKCHGELGKGDGPSAPELKDDAGIPIKPRDFSDGSQFVGASDPKGVYQTFTTGLDGTPMPSFADFLPEDKRWHLVWYVTSLRTGFDLEKVRSDLLKERERNAKAVKADASAKK
jgi:cytochrome c oxidase cbb3-type subunit 2